MRTKRRMRRPQKKTTDEIESHTQCEKHFLEVIEIGQWIGLAALDQHNSR
jgi:hypothetical protein